MKKLQIALYLSFLFSVAGLAQELLLEEMKLDRPSPDFHRSRRAALRQLLPPKTLAIIFANPVRNRANDVNYVYHQNPDLYYLTGYKEPHSMLLISSEDVSFDNEVLVGELMFVQPRDEQMEMWNGKRLGTEGVKNKLGLNDTMESPAFKDYDLQLDKYDNVYVLNMREDVYDGRDDYDLYDLIEQFKKKVNVTEPYSQTKDRVYTILRSANKANHDKVAQQLFRYRQFDNRLQKWELVQKFLMSNSWEERQKIIAQVPEFKVKSTELSGIMDRLREIKIEEELYFLRKAVRISCMGQNEVMKAMHTEMSEREIQGIHEFVYRKLDAEYQGYPSIVGAGHNGCILHYWENEKLNVGGELVLMDLGAEYRGYTADVTRTIPASGKFTPEQKIIYDIVYEAQQAGFEACKVANPFDAPDQAAREIINKRLAEVGIIESPDTPHQYFPHGTSHYLGLDVHDRGEYGLFKHNTVITVEPGIYIPEGSPCDEKWWGIAVRIEDDILITNNGWENLSVTSPRKSEEIEAMMAQPSIFSDFKPKD